MATYPITTDVTTAGLATLVSTSALEEGTQYYNTQTSKRYLATSVNTYIELHDKGSDAETTTTIAAINHGTSEKTTLIDADEVTGQNSANSFSLIRTTWTNVKVFLKTYFDGLFFKLDQTTPQTVTGGQPIFTHGLKFGTSPTIGGFVEGKLFYDILWKTLGLEIDTDVTLQIGQETQAYCMNVTGSPITNGSVVYISGASGGYPTIALADNSDVAKSFVLGVVTTASIASGGYGHVTIRGHVNGLNTSAFSVGDSLYLGDTAGTLATSISAGRYEVRIGRVMIDDPATGRVYVNIRPLERLGDLADVTVAGAAVDDVLRFNGTEWINGAPVTSSASAGIEFFNCTPVINAVASPAGISATGAAGNGIQVNSLSKTPVTSAEQLIVGASASDTRAFVAWLYDTALGRTSIDAGTWDFTSFAAVNSVLAGRVTTLTRQIYQVVPVSAGSVTITDLGANTKTATITSGQFTGTYFAGSATNTTASYLQTPSGIYQISAVASVNSVTIIVPTGYVNETTVTFKIWNKLFGSTSAAITSTGTNYVQYDQSSVQGAFTVAVTDKLGQMGFVTSNNTTNITVAYNGTTHSTHFSTPLITLHNNLAGLNAAGGNYQHLTDAEKTVATQAASAAQNGYLSSGNFSTFVGKIANVVEDTTPQLGGDLDVNGKSVDWGAILTVNSTYKGDTLLVDVDTNSIGFGCLLAQGADFSFDEADASAMTTCNMIVMAVEAGTGTKKALLMGQVCNTGWTWVRGPIYASETLGGLTQELPLEEDAVIAPVAWALSATTIYFNPYNAWATTYLVPHTTTTSTEP